ncbi:MAG: 30S ribosomal protein S15 [Candidatus Azosocius agrarius]|nr:MAG: 30S ribosomal protein S15 [Gammaproteobacteria bacterium]
MKLTKVEKQCLINEYKAHDKDTGSSSVQISLLSANINYLIEHLKVHKKDKHSRRGLIGLVNKRRKLLNYLKINCCDKYLDLIKRLGIRK